VVTALAAPAAAGRDDSNALFDAGVLQMEAGRYDQACPSIEHSYELDPRPGVLFTLAECQSKRGRVAAAVDRYGEYLRLYEALPPAKKKLQTNRPKTARAQIAALSPQIPKLVLELALGAPSGALIELDGRALAASALGTSMPVDPGEHVVRTSVANGPLSETRVTLARGESRRVVLNVRRAPADAPAIVAAPPLTGKRVVGLVLGGAGLLGLGVGIVAGTAALVNKSDIVAHCNVGGIAEACDHQGIVAANHLESASLVSTVGFLAGGAFVTLGVVLLSQEAADLKAAAAKPAVSVGPRRLEVRAASAGATGGSVFLQGAW